MQISTSSFYDRSTSLMSKLAAKSDRLQTQISTTVRLQSAADDVVAYRQLAGMTRASADDAAYAANIATGTSLLAQADTTLDAVTDRLQRATELATQATTGTLKDSDRQAIATELRSILDDLVVLANTKDSRGQPLFGAATGDSAVTQASDGSVSFTGTGDPAALPIGDGVSIHATDSAAKVFSLKDTTGTATDMFAVVKGLADALDAAGGVSDAARKAQDDLALASTQVASARGSLGARATRLKLDAAQLKAVGADREIARSGLEDTDITAAVTELQKTMTVLQATQASFTKLSSLSLFDYLK